MSTNKKEYSTLIKILLDNGANPNLKDSKGNTALYYAENSSFDMFRDNDAMKKDAEEVVKMLKKEGAGG
jgi:ankyrin repeat protein